MSEHCNCNHEHGHMYTAETNKYEQMLAQYETHIHDEEIYLKNYPQYKFTATVDNVEPLGASTNLFLLIGGQQFTATVDPTSTAKMGDKVEITFEADRVHLFDPDTEKCIDL